ncbi:MAG: sensory box histidine kinase/response regulator [Myxococcaceae bacterium]|nr:sensory box histidine kinase/response regulator [Myxococcaceae bacterium]
MTMRVVVTTSAEAAERLVGELRKSGVDVEADHLSEISDIARTVERVRAEAERQTELARRGWLLEKVVDALPFIVFVKDASELRLEVANETFAKAFNTSKSSLIGRLDHDYFPKEQADSFVTIDRSVLEGKRMRVFEEVARADGEDRFFLTKKMPIFDDVGEARYLLGITEDITERKEAEQALVNSKIELESSVVDLQRSREISARTLAGYQRRALQMEIIRQQNEDLDRLAADLARAKRAEEERSRELEASARLKGEFLANFSHEIRTPLNGILGYCDLLMRGEGVRLTPHGRRDLNVIKSNAKTLLSLINDILDLSKIEAGRADVVSEHVDVAELVEECNATVKEMLRGKDVLLTAQISESARVAYSDALKLRQIVLNLLSNAAKFTDSGEISVNVSEDEGVLVIDVDDTGSGIPDHELGHIFEKFRQVDGTSTRRVGGTGLGLAIVRELAKVLGGTVAVKSTLGRGSSFSVRLPGAIDTSRVRPTRVEEGSSPPRAAYDGATILLVDDDPLVQHLVRGELEGEGFRVLSAADGLHALRLAREHHPAAILLDLHLPKLHGWDVLAELKTDPTVANVPVIILSVEEQRARGFSLGACEYLVKPVELELLTSVVRRAVAPGGGEVLVADDDDLTRAMVCRQLQQIGFHASEARDGEEAILRARVAPPALLILDLVMPNVDGFEVLRRLRAEGSKVPVVVLTGKDLGVDEERLLSEGFARVVRKGGLALDQVVAEAKRLVVEQRTVRAATLPRILYIEDSAQNRDIVRRYLAGEFQLLEAADGEEGLACVEREKPDLVLMDLSLPRVDGWEATRRIKASATLKHIPVIALSAHASAEDQERARGAGCIDYLTKPIEHQVLHAAIRKHLPRGAHG